MSHASHHNILTGAQSIDNQDQYSHIVSVRSDRVDSWIKKGYEVIEDSDDSCLIGKRKTVQELAADKKAKEDAIRKAKEAKEAEELKAKQIKEKAAKELADKKAAEIKAKEKAEWLAEADKLAAEQEEENKNA